jgi:hypothetical protein
MSNYIEIRGQKFGRLTVVRQNFNKKNRMQEKTYWDCICDCGNTTVVIKEKLLNGHTASCGCFHRDQLIANNIGRGSNPVYSAMRNLYRSYIKSARNREIEFDITIEEFEELTTSTCSYCGTEPHINWKGHRKESGYIYNGIDRLDRSIGYVIGNCVTSCKKCNWAKGKMGVKEFGQFIKNVYEFSFGGVV